MIIDPGTVARHLEAAAAEQVAERLGAEGYKVEREVRFEGMAADLVAKKGDETLVYEFVVPGRPRSPERANVANMLRTLVAKLGGRFKLVLVRPPRETRVEVEGLEEVLARACDDHPAVRGLAPATLVRDVGEIELRSVRVDRAGTRLSGEAAVTVQLREREDENEFEELVLDLGFDLALDRDGKLTALDRLNIEIPSWLTSPIAAQ